MVSRRLISKARLRHGMAAKMFVISGPSSYSERLQASCTGDIWSSSSWYKESAAGKPAALSLYPWNTPEFSGILPFSYVADQKHVFFYNRQNTRHTAFSFI
jgi:cell wall assembly regulator SMI1